MTAGVPPRQDSGFSVSSTMTANRPMPPPPEAQRPDATAGRRRWTADTDGPADTASAAPFASTPLLYTESRNNSMTTIGSRERERERAETATTVASSTATAPTVASTVEEDVHGTVNDDASTEPPPPPPPPSSPPPKPHEEARDGTASTTSNATDGASQRASLRDEVSRKRHALTVPEQVFLERLTVEGNDIEIELALQTLADDELFFEYSTPRHLKYHAVGLGGHHNQNSAGASGVDVDDDASRDAAASFSVHSNASGRGESGGAGTTTSGPPPGGDDEEASITSFSSSHYLNDPLANTGSNSSLPQPPLLRLGSERRLQALEERRKPGGLEKIWKAHESGLAVTTAASKKSIWLRRESSSAGSHVSGAGSSGGSYISSDGQRMSGPAMNMISRNEQSLTEPSIFRVRPDGSNGDKDKVKIATSTTATTKNASVRSGMPPLRPRRVYARSKSMTASTTAMRGSSASLGSLSARTNSGGSSSGSGSGSSVPKVPEPGRMNRRVSTSSRRSVTFHGIDEEQEEGHDNEANKAIQKAAPRRSKILRRAVSDSLQYESPSQRERKREQQQQKEVAREHDPQRSQEEKKEASSDDASIPSLHHGRPIRQDSMSSIPSLHHGHPIRQDSMSSIPSLHHAHAIGQDSVSSIPSLHHGRPIRQDSVASIASRNLHIANPIRSDASMGSIPSLHHGRPLHGAQDKYWDELSEDRRLSLTKEQLMRQYAASEDIASAWLQQGPHDSPERVPVRSATRPQNETSVEVEVEDPNDPCHLRNASLGSLPHDVTIPISETETTVATTSQDDVSLGDGVNLDDSSLPPSPPPGAPMSKPILMRLASRNIYEGEGIEVTELEDGTLQGDYDSTPVRSNLYINTAPILSMDASVRTVTSYDDEALSILSGRRTSGIFRNIRRSLSDEDLSSMFIGQGGELFLRIPTSVSGRGGYYGPNALSPMRNPATDLEDTSVTSASWDMNSDMELSGRFDAWNVLQDDYANGYGGAGTLGFSILGTCADDESAKPHVLSPPLMESLQAFLPFAKSGENFFLKYSMVRDGASLPTLLKRCRGVQYSILAVETIDGEVFGSFTAQPWRKNWNYFGTGESFLWKMRRCRLEKTHGILDQAAMESEIDVYPYTGENRFIQLCTHDRLAVGGGVPSGEKKTDGLESPKVHEWGFGLAVQSDMLQGSSSPCITFGSPSLSSTHSDGSLFEIINIELWTLTPCMTVEEAEKLELGKLFLQRNSNDSIHYAY